MKKRILIITDALPPSFAPRMSYLMNELSTKGYNITAFALQQPQSNCDLPTGNALIHNFVYSCSSPIIRLLQLIGEVLFDYKNKWFYRQIKPYLRGKTFDAVLCSSYETFPLPTALNIAKSLQLPLLVDLRDITEQFGENYYKNRHPKAPWLGKWFAKIKIRQRNKVLKQANAISTISPWHQDFLRKWNKQVHLIYNGYDATTFYFKPISSQKFDIVYTGRLIDSETRNPLLLFQALDQLIAEKAVDCSHLQIKWWIDNDSKKILDAYLTAYPRVKKQTIVNDMVAASSIPPLLMEASVVLILSNKQTLHGPKGIMTTKFFEALGVEKPVLCVTSDEACLASAIEKTNAGVAATQVTEVKHFILEKYAEWQKNGYTHQAVIQQEKVPFSRQEQAQAFENIIQSFL